MAGRAEKFWGNSYIERLDASAFVGCFKHRKGAREGQLRQCDHDDIASRFSAANQIPDPPTCICPKPNNSVWHAATANLPGTSPLVLINLRYLGSTGHSAPIECDSMMAVFPAHLASILRSSSARFARPRVPRTNARTSGFASPSRLLIHPLLQGLANLFELERGKLNLDPRLLTAAVATHPEKPHENIGVKFLQQPV